MTLAGRTIVNFSTGTVEDALALQALITSRGGQYIDGGIMCYPRDVGKRETIMLYSGARAAYERFADTLEILAGDQRYLNENVRAAATVYLALWAYYFGALAAYFEGAALASTVLIDIAAFQSLADNMTAKLREQLLEASHRVMRSDYSGDQATIDVHVAGLEIVRDAYVKEELAPETVNAFLTHTRKAQAEGYGSKDIACMFEVMKRKS